MKPVIEFLRFCSQIGEFDFGDSGLAHGLEVLFNGFDSLQVGRNLLLREMGTTER